MGYEDTWGEILRKLNGRETVNPQKFAEENGMSRDMLKQMLMEMDERGLVNFRKFTMWKWRIQPTSRGVDFLNGKI